MKPPTTSLLELLLAAAWLVAAAGCQQKMAAQPSYKPLQASTMFSDGQASRPLVEGTVARGHLHTNLALHTGRKTAPIAPQEKSSSPADAAAVQPLSRAEEDDSFVTEIPLAIDTELLEHGRNRYTIFCVPCHDSLGSGRGKIVERGYTRPPSYHLERLRTAPAGRLFAVISQGYGAMPSHAAQIPVEDRWAIVAYVRALQRSQHFPADEATEEMRQQIQTEDQR
jgi:mono/diheme cytochrome c family protein